MRIAARLTLALLVSTGMALALTVGLRAQDPSPATPAVATPPLPQEPARPPFAEWLAGVREEALSRGLPVELVDAALARVEEPQAVIIERDRTQAEIVLPLEHYIDRQLSAKLIKAGRETYQANTALLQQVSKAYGIPPRILVAIWGIESNYGRFSGVRPTIPALATLAYDPRRSRFFRNELFKALEIINEGDITLEQMKGSWAGAMGQPQFMPSSYLDYAQDFDGDGRRDIWSTPADVLASMANYLVGAGWTHGEAWGREVKVSPSAAAKIKSVAHRDGGCTAKKAMTVALPVDEWRKLGVKAMGGGNLPKSLPPASLVSGASRHFLVYANYDALLGYNCAHSYALTVGLLGDLVSVKPKR